MSKSVYGRVRAGSGIKATEEEYDIREDEEQQVKEQETLQLLVTAGYFRARIKGLATFDKVIGGMTWCIQGCSVDIDVDLLFKENANIGKKIALTEKIVRALKRMKCPHRIEPHQIQGSDFRHIYPVVQWLVMQAIGYRDERMAKMRRFAVSQFDQSIGWAQDEEAVDEENRSITDDVIRHLENAYRPKRKYRKPESAKVADKETQVQTTLLEYGKRTVISGGADQGDASAGDQEGDMVHSKEEQERIQELMSGMSTSMREGRLAANIVSSILSMKSAEMQEAVSQYEEQSASLSQLFDTLDGLHPQQSEKIKQALANQIEELKAKNEQLSEEVNALSSRHGELRGEWQQVVTRDRDLDSRKEDMEKQVQENEVLEELQSLISLHDALKKQEQDFKASCKKELARMQEEIAQLKEGKSTTEEDKIEIQQLQDQSTKDKEKLQKARLHMASATQSVNEAERRLDDIPSQWETQQYQRRFLELYEQIESTYSENKRLYDRYNTEEAVRNCLQKEVNLLNSIHDNFELAMSTSGGKEQFMKQMEQISSSIQQMKINGENQRELTKASRDGKKEEYAGHVEKGRQYARMVKDFQEACRQYDQLLQRCNQLGLEV